MMPDGEKFVLQVEDNKMDADLVREIFKRAKIPNRIMVLTDGEQAINFLLGSKAQSSEGEGSLPQAILLDLKLPKVDGIEVLQRLRAVESTKHIPVVILSSSKNEHDVSESYRLGANSFLCKSADFTEYEKLLRLFADYWLNCNIVAK